MEEDVCVSFLVISYSSSSFFFFSRGQDLAQLAAFVRTGYDRSPGHWRSLRQATRLDGETVYDSDISLLYSALSGGALSSCLLLLPSLLFYSDWQAHGAVFYV